MEKYQEEGRTFEDSLRELEGILERLENSQVPLDEMIKSYERAKACLVFCRKKLGEAELKVRKLGVDGSAEEVSVGGE